MQKYCNNDPKRQQIMKKTSNVRNYHAFHDSVILKISSISRIVVFWRKSVRVENSNAFQFF